MHTQINPDEKSSQYYFGPWWCHGLAKAQTKSLFLLRLRPHLHFSSCDHVIEEQYPDITCMFSILLHKSMCTLIMVSTAGGSPVMD